MMGYDDFYSKSSFNIDETIGLGLSDKSEIPSLLFRKSWFKLREKLKFPTNNFISPKLVALAKLVSQEINLLFYLMKSLLL